MSQQQYTSCHNSVSLDECYVGKIDEALARFNSAYQCYQEGCVNNCSSMTPCDYSNVVQPAYDNLMGIINEVLGKTRPLELPSSDASLNDIQTHYSELVKLRETLDNRMSELHRNDLFPIEYNDAYNYLDYAAYTHVMWIVLATTFGYFAFMQMRD
jgi:hypothetical protein